MEITLYQINPERDYDEYEFKHFEFANDTESIHTYTIEYGLVTLKLTNLAKFT